MRPFALGFLIIAVLGGCGGGGGGGGGRSHGAGGSTGGGATPGPSPAPARGPALESARLVDRDGNGLASPGDEVVLRFDEDADLSRLSVGDLALLSQSDSFGASPSVVQIGPREASVVLGAGTALSLYRTYAPGAPSNRSPAAVSLRNLSIVRGASGLPARAARPAPVLLDRPQRLEFQGDRSRGTLPFYLGQMHSHTIFSDGSVGDPAMAWDTARFQGGLDWFMVSDHVEALLPLPYRWDETKRMADARNVDGVFIAITGYEWSFAFRDVLHTELYNHCNIVTADLIDAGSTLSLDGMYRAVDSFSDDAIGKFNHPAWRTNSFLGVTIQFNNWDDYRYDPKADRHFALVRVTTGSNNDAAGYIPFLDHGWHVAPAYGEDNHYGAWGLGPNRMGIYAPFLTRDALKDGMRLMRTFTSSDRTAWIKLVATDDVGAGDLFMGSTIVGPGPVELHVTGGDPDDGLARVEIVSSGGTVVASEALSGANDVDWKTVVDPSGDAYFYARIVEEDGDLVFSAPIFVDR
jgi:hypothetical protein